jgi:hypothetical protein
MEILNKFFCSVTIYLGAVIQWHTAPAVGNSENYITWKFVVAAVSSWIAWILIFIEKENFLVCFQLKKKIFLWQNFIQIQILLWSDKGRSNIS